MEVKGYKAFNKDTTNRYGQPFTEGGTYRVFGELKFGNDGNGLHMCLALSDVFRFVNATEEDVLVAEVTGRGNFIQRDDTYYGYYDMFCFEELTIDNFLSREEVIKRMLMAPPHEIKKFLSTCRLSEEEKILFARKHRNNAEVLKDLLYYHFGCKDIYSSYKVNKDEQIRLVLEHGQNSNKGCEGE